MKTILFAIFAMMLLFAPPLTAQTNKAKKAFDRGISAMDDHDYKQALDAFELAYETKPHWAVLVHMAKCHAKLNHPGKAIELYEQYLENGKDKINSNDRKKAKKNINIYKKKVGTLLLFVKPKNTKIQIDDDLIGNPPFGEILLRKGPHTILAIRDDAEEEIEINIDAGKELTLRLYPKEENPIIPAPASITKNNPNADITPTVKKTDDPTTGSAEPAPDPNGVLQVLANIEGANVDINGEFQGESPVEEIVIAGSYQLTVGADGYISYDGYVDVLGGQINTVNVNLVSAANNKPNRLSVPFFVTAGLAGAGLIMGVTGFVVYGINNASYDNYSTHSDFTALQDNGWNDDYCDNRTLLPGGTPQEFNYFCQHLYKTDEYERKSKLGFGFGVAGTAIFALSGTAAALLFFMPELFGDRNNSEATISIAPVATNNQTGFVLMGKF